MGWAATGWSCGTTTQERTDELPVRLPSGSEALLLLDADPALLDLAALDEGVGLVRPVLDPARPGLDLSARGVGGERELPLHPSSGLGHGVRDETAQRGDVGDRARVRHRRGRRRAARACSAAESWISTTVLLGTVRVEEHDRDPQRRHGEPAPVGQRALQQHRRSVDGRRGPRRPRCGTGPRARGRSPSRAPGAGGRGSGPRARRSRSRRRAQPPGGPCPWPSRSPASAAWCTCRSAR